MRFDTVLSFSALRSQLSEFLPNAISYGLHAADFLYRGIDSGTVLNIREINQVKFFEQLGGAIASLWIGCRTSQSALIMRADRAPGMLLVV
jgi:hypothetical protein